MSAIQRRKCCCQTNPTGWYTCKPVYCADAFVNEGFPSLQEDAQFITYLNESDIAILEEENLFPFGDAFYWHDGTQLWVLDETSDYLGDAPSPRYLDPPIFAPEKLVVNFSGADNVLRQPPPPLQSFVTVSDGIETTTNLGVLLFATLQAGYDIGGHSFTVFIDTDPGPNAEGNELIYGYRSWYRPTYGMATNPITTVNVKGLDIDLEQYYWHVPQPPENYRECAGNRGSGTHSAPVSLVGGSFAYGPLTVDNFYGTDTTYEQPKCGLDVKMVIRSFRDVPLVPECNGVIRESARPYFYQITPPNPEDQNLELGLCYQDQSPCPDPSFPDPPCKVFCEPNPFIPDTPFSISPGVQVRDCNRSMKISQGLCSLFSGAPSSESYVVPVPGVTAPDPINGLRPNDCKAVGISGTAVNFPPPYPGFSIGEEIFGVGLVVLQPILIA
jgi:hypothetical protein